MLSSEEVSGGGSGADSEDTSEEDGGNTGSDEDSEDEGTTGSEDGQSGNQGSLLDDWPQSPSEELELGSNGSELLFSPGREDGSSTTAEDSSLPGCTPSHLPGILPRTYQPVAVSVQDADASLPVTSQ